MHLAQVGFHLCKGYEKDPNFDGYDWTELADHFEIPRDVAVSASEGELCSFLTQLLRLQNACDQNVVINPPPVPLINSAVEDAKVFLKALLANEHTHVGWHPVWEGLIQTESNSVFLQAFIPLLDYMWT